MAAEFVTRRSDVMTVDAGCLPTTGAEPGEQETNGYGQNLLFWLGPVQPSCLDVQAERLMGTIH